MKNHQRNLGLFCGPNLDRKGRGFFEIALLRNDLGRRNREKLVCLVCSNVYGSGGSVIATVTVFEAVVLWPTPSLTVIVTA